MMRQRTYLDGKLVKSGKPNDAETVRRWLDQTEAHWTRGGMLPLVGPGEFDTNQAHEVTRISPDELHIVTTGGNRLRIVNVEVKR